LRVCSFGRCCETGSVSQLLGYESFAASSCRATRAARAKRSRFRACLFWPSRAAAVRAQDRHAAAHRERHAQGCGTIRVASREARL